MNVYEVRHEGHYLAGLSIAVAASEERAAEIVRESMAVHGLKTGGNIHVVCQLAVDEERCYLLDDGDY